MNDQKLLNKGLALLPDLYESYVEAERTVAIAKDGQGAVCVGPAESYRTRLLKKGDSVVLDFGDHQVGYLSSCSLWKVVWVLLYNIVERQ